MSEAKEKWTRLMEEQKNTVLKGASQKTIRQWLSRGLNGYFEGDLGRWAFQPMEDHIHRNYDLVGDLREVYQTLPDKTQQPWRLAMCDLLLVYAGFADKRKHVSALLTLAQLLGAAETCEVLVEVLEKDSDTGYQVLNLLLSLVHKLDGKWDRKVFECMDSVSRSDSFHSSGTGLLMAGMCQANPEMWPWHVEALGDHMKAQIADMKEKGEDLSALRFFAERILEAAGDPDDIPLGTLRFLAESDKTAWLVAGVRQKARRFAVRQIEIRNGGGGVMADWLFLAGTVAVLSLLWGPVFWAWCKIADQHHEWLRKAAEGHGDEAR